MYSDHCRNTQAHVVHEKMIKRMDIMLDTLDRVRMRSICNIQCFQICIAMMMK